MKIYHYTKCSKLNSIFLDGFIATELKRTTGDGYSATDYVWLTEKNTYPKTALPFIYGFPETSILTHVQHKGVYVNLDKLGALVGSFYRFSFESTDTRIKKWFFSEERKNLKDDEFWRRMESLANKAGDDVRSFWISHNDIALENFSLEVFDGDWKPLLTDVSLSTLNRESKKVIEELKTLSIQKCEELGFPQSYQLAA